MLQKPMTSNNEILSNCFCRTILTHTHTYIQLRTVSHTSSIRIYLPTKSVPKCISNIIASKPASCHHPIMFAAFRKQIVTFFLSIGLT